MPQMSPMNWVILFTFFIFMMVSICSKVFFSTSNNPLIEATNASHTLTFFPKSWLW